MINPVGGSHARSYLSSSQWNLLSQKYNEVFIGLKGSKSISSFFSVFPSASKPVPQNKTNPLLGVLLYSLSLSLAEV